MFSHQRKPERKVALSRAPWARALASRQFIQPQFSCQENLLAASMLDWARRGAVRPAEAASVNRVGLMAGSLSIGDVHEGVGGGVHVGLDGHDRGGGVSGGDAEVGGVAAGGVAEDEATRAVHPDAEVVLGAVVALDAAVAGDGV